MRQNSEMKEKIVVLFNYGGGMRGLIPCYILQRIEELTGYPITEMVDVFAGPSTGSIINAGLNVPDPFAPDKPRYKAKHLARFYEREGIKIFPPDKSRAFRGLIHDFNNRTMKLSQLNWLLRHGHYDSSYLHKALKKLYGDTKLEETLQSVIIPVYNIDGEQISLAEELGDTEDTPVRTKNNFVDEGGHALWFKNIIFDRARRLEKPYDVSLINCVMGSTAAPTYFPCHHFTAKDSKENLRAFTGIDGSIFDNPCISYLGALRPHLPENRDILFIALGTGYTHRSITKEEWNRLGSLGVVDPVNDLPLISIFFHASESALLESFDREVGDNLHVFNKSMLGQSPETPSLQIDDASRENLKKLKSFSEEIMEENSQSLDSLCDKLVMERDKKYFSRTGKSIKRKLFGFLKSKKSSR